MSINIRNFLILFDYPKNVSGFPPALNTINHIPKL
jgi:hypothetical protein